MDLSVELPFAGTNPGIVAGILVVSLVAAVTVLWVLVHLVVDPRAGSADDGQDLNRLDAHEPGDAAFEVG